GGRSGIGRGQMLPADPVRLLAGPPGAGVPDRLDQFRFFHGMPPPHAMSPREYGQLLAGASAQLIVRHGSALRRRQSNWRYRFVAASEPSGRAKSTFRHEFSKFPSRPIRSADPKSFRTFPS